MARTILTLLVIVLLNVLVGCSNIDSGKSQLMPARTKTSIASAPIIQIAQAGEVDIVEQVAVNRQSYRQGLELLIDYYTKGGNSMKLDWAQKELKSLNSIPQYKYIIEASIAGPNLKTTTSIPEADELYEDAAKLAEKAGQLFIIKDQDTLRLALDKYNQLIKKYPSSDKIDDAAYNAGKIYEYFKDYSIALLYYQRTYQWDPQTIYPSKFRAAYTLDKHLKQRAQALELYKQALGELKDENQHKQWKEYTQSRIKELTKSDEKLE